MAAFQTLLGLGTGRKPTTYKQIRGGVNLTTCRRLTSTYWGLLKQPDKHKATHDLDAPGDDRLGCP